jgi:hypothetical protein
MARVSPVSGLNSTVACWIGQAVLDLVDLPLDLVVDGLLHEAEAVQVLDLAPRAQRRAGRRTETLASQRKLPSCMLPSQMPSHTTSACSALGVGHRLGAASACRAR